MIDLSIHTDSFIKYNYSQGLKPKGKESLSFIFMDNMNFFRHLYNIGKLRDVTYDNIQKTILCGSVYLGYDLYSCPDCGEETIIPNRCHSRFCTTCGSKETKVRSAKVSAMALDAHHRHIVFTIPESLRGYFIVNRKLLDLLFIAARNSLACLFNNEKFRKRKKKMKLQPRRKVRNRYAYKNDRQKVVFGAVMTLHTFGRDLKWNPHIHCLVCEEAYDTFRDSMKNFSFMSYEKLRKTWMFQILELLSREDLKGFEKIRRDLYRINDNGFYVYAKRREDEDDDDVEECVKYITRYTSRPAIAESRIIRYESDRKMIRWWYNRHEDDRYVEVYEDVHEFLKKLILHCPEENFRMTRYYGFYSNKNKKLLDKVYELHGRKMKGKRHVRNMKERKKEIEDRLRLLKYRTHMIQSYGRDPILCRCGSVMKYEETYDPFKGGKYNDRRYREDCINESRRLARGRGRHFD